jgi:hypothetical protein
MEKYKNATGILTYRNPPIFAWFISPLGSVSYNKAFGIFTFLNILFLYISLILLWKLELITNSKELYLAITFLPLAHSVFIGQLTIFIFLAFILSMYLIKSGNPLLAGFIGSLSLVKFQRFILNASLSIVLKDKLKYLIGATIGVLLYVILNIVVYQSFIEGFSRFILKTEGYEYGTELSSSYSIQSIIQIMSPNLNQAQNFAITTVISLIGLLSVNLYILKLSRAHLHPRMGMETVVLIYTSLLFGIHTLPSDYLITLVPLLYFKRIGYNKLAFLTFILPWLGFVPGTAWIVTLSSLAIIIYTLSLLKNSEENFFDQTSITQQKTHPLEDQTNIRPKHK